MQLNFGHSEEQIRFWRSLVTPQLKREPTPFYLFSLEPIQEALQQLEKEFKGLPVQPWLSFKTQPVRPLIQWWSRSGRGVEVVSEFEFLAALKEKCLPEQLLVNGPAKQRWLSRHRVRNISVNFDSPAEAAALLPLAKQLNWRIGIRINTTQEFDPEEPGVVTQFGFLRNEAIATLKKLQREKVRLEMVHFHLRTNISSADVYEMALQEVLAICGAARFQPRIVNCGGGFPAPNVLTCNGRRVDAGFSFRKMRRVYERVLERFPQAEEIWLENGRWLSARSGVLVVKILEAKQRGKMRNLICDGGRTMNAMLSLWHQHQLFPIPQRGGKTTTTTVNGPTCMAFDRLTRRSLPASLRAGDFLVWMDAGAYHVPWETRFSHGWPAVLWHDGKKTKIIRHAEGFKDWWGQWE